MEGNVEGMTAIAKAIVVGLGMMGPAIGLGILVGKGLEAIGRNPEASNTMSTFFYVGLAAVEALAFLAFAMAFLI